MNPLLRDLLQHQFWADADLWNAIDAHEPARADKVIRDRLHHLHQVQRAFFWAVADPRPSFTITNADDFATLDAVRVYAREAHDAMRAGMAAMSDVQLDQPIEIPWFKDPPLTLTRTEALTQCAMHSQHHRAQNATRLRELGGTPPPTDLIVWYWKGRPLSHL
jgi:uncharacterized damage-inducible protein DinB